jgi:microcompartment protein CcmL/EutN
MTDGPSRKAGEGDARGEKRVALALIELDSVAHGLLAADAMVKTAPVDLLAATHATPGKFVIVIGGGVAEVESSLQKGLLSASGHLIDHLFLAQVDPQVLSAVGRRSAVEDLDAIGVVETGTLSTAILAGDAAAKGAGVRLLDIRLARGLHGRGFVTMTGAVSDVEAGVDLGERAAAAHGFPVMRVVIPRPHEDVLRRLSEGRWGEIEGQEVI